MLCSVHILNCKPVCVIEGVASPEKEKTKLGETSLSGWLQSKFSIVNNAVKICSHIWYLLTWEKVHCLVSFVV